MFLSATGKILQCERIDHDFVLGYVHAGHVELDCKFIAEFHNHYITKCMELCIDCAASRNCPQCVYDISDIREDKPQCNGFCSKEKIDHNEEQTLDFLREHPEYYEKILKTVSIRY